MCVSNGAPKSPTAQDEKQKAIQELWDLLQSHDAVFLGNAELKSDLDKFLKKNKIKHEDANAKQTEYADLIEKAISKYSVVA